MGAKLLLALCAVASLLHGATTARLPRMQHPKVTAPMIPDDDDNQFYAAYENHECKKCPPGTFVLRPCTVPRTEGTCQPCENNTYSKLSNSFDYCFGCRACRSLAVVPEKKRYRIARLQVTSNVFRMLPHHLQQVPLDQEIIDWPSFFCLFRLL